MEDNVAMFFRSGLNIEVADSNASIIDQGLFDFIDLAELVGLVEEEFGISIADGDKVADSFASINSVVSLIQRSS